LLPSRFAAEIAGDRSTRAVGSKIGAKVAGGAVAMTAQVQTVPFTLTRRSSRPPPSTEHARFRARKHACQLAFALAMGVVVMLFTVELGAVRSGAALPFTLPQLPSF
jgi:hypothetical protein